MSTRAAAAREAAFIASSTTPSLQSLPSQAPSQKSNARRVRKIDAGGNAKRGKEENLKDVDINDSTVSRDYNKTLRSPAELPRESAEVDQSLQDVDGNAIEEPSPNKAIIARKRKRAAAKPKNGDIINREVVKGGWDELPHNMGKANDNIVNEDEKQPASFEAVVLPPKKAPGDRKVLAKKTRAETAIAEEDESPGMPEIERIKQEAVDEFKEDLQTTMPQKRSRKKAKSPNVTLDIDSKDSKPNKKGLEKEIDFSNVVEEKVDELVNSAEKTTKKVKKGKKNPYGLSPGESPFPDFVMPTLEACKEVNDLLSEVHGVVEPPKTIPAPSLEVTGCGEVPSVLDALIRTRLSAATTSTNSGYAFAGLVKKYGIRESGIGKGSVDWNKVRDGNVVDLEKAIKRGGLAKSKSVSIMRILDMVHEQNTLRRDAFVKEKETGEKPDLVGVDRMEVGHKEMEIAIVEQNILSLDYMHGLTPDEAMAEFTKYPGVGVKTASCVILFCLRRPSFAVDTHVWRFCKWLKWVPEGATRDQTFSHCEVRVPDDMKYSLHQLFIRHGKTCGRCRAATGEMSEGWATTICPIEKLVTRTGKRKGYVPATKTTSGGKGRKTKKSDDWEGDIDMDDTTENEGEPELNDDEENDDKENNDEAESSAIE